VGEGGGRRRISDGNGRKEAGSGGGAYPLLPSEVEVKTRGSDTDAGLCGRGKILSRGKGLRLWKVRMKLRG
jgi:hypothetical protein